MQLKEFDYDVFLMVDISGHELLFLTKLSLRHYDATCRAAGMVGGFLYGFCNHWGFAADGEWNCDIAGAPNLERIETIKMKGRELDTLAKICEYNFDEKNLLTPSDFVLLLNCRKLEYNRLKGISS